jgi:hypothetical protein
MLTTRTVKKIIAGALLSGGVAAVTALGLGAGTAQAFNYPVGVCNDAHHVCSYQWCPGMPLPFTGGANNPPSWDMVVCHNFMQGMIGPSSPDWVKGNGNHAVGPMLIEGDPLPSPGVGPCQGVFPCLPGL